MAKVNDTHPYILMTFIGALYLSQGVPMGLAFVGLPAIMRSLGISTELIGLLGIVILPWAIKFMWAPLVDRLQGGPFGPRKSWIIPTQIICGLLFFALAFLITGDKSDFTLVIGIIILINTVSATQDIAADGLAIDCFKGKQIDQINGWQIGAFAIGMAIGGSATLILYDNGGWSLALVTLGCIMLSPLMLVFFVKEPKKTSTAQQSHRYEKTSIKQTFKRPNAGKIIIVAALFQSVHAMVNAMGGPFLVDAGLSLTEIGTLTGTVITVFAVIGSLFGAICAGFIGAPLTAILAGSIAAVALSLWLGPAQSMKVTFNEVLMITGFISIFVFAAYAAFFTIFMRWASPKQAGTDFTVLQCTETFFAGLAAMLAGVLVGQFGFYNFYLITLFMAILAMTWIGFSFFRLGYLSQPWLQKTKNNEGDAQSAQS